MNWSVCDSHPGWQDFDPRLRLQTFSEISGHDQAVTKEIIHRGQYTESYPVEVSPNAQPQNESQTPNKSLEPHLPP